MDEKLEIRKYDKINNRRHDDIVVVIRHEYKAKVKLKHKIYIEYFNEYAEMFFGFKVSPDINVLFDSILKQDIKLKILDTLKDLDLEDENTAIDFDTKYDLATIIRKFSTIVMINKNKYESSTSIKIFPLDCKINKEKMITNTFYYLIIRSIDVEIQFSNFRNAFFTQHSLSSSIDQQYGVGSIGSIINEMKMLIDYKKQNPHIMIAVGKIMLNRSFKKDILLIQTSIQLFLKNTRGNDYIGIIDDSTLFIMFFNYADIKTVKHNLSKISTRIENIIKLNQYVFESYHNQSHNLLKIALYNLDEKESYNDLSVKLL